MLHPRLAASATIALGLLAAPLVVEAQRPPAVRRIAYLTPTIRELPSTFHEILREGLRHLGYVEGPVLARADELINP